MTTSMIGTRSPTFEGHVASNALEGDKLLVALIALVHFVTAAGKGLRQRHLLKKWDRQ